MNLIKKKTERMMEAENGMQKARERIKTNPIKSALKVSMFPLKVTEKEKRFKRIR